MHFDIQSPIFDLKIGVEYRTYPIWIFYIFSFKIWPNIGFEHSNSFFDIQIGTKYRFFTFRIIFRLSNWVWISIFNVQNPIFAFFGLF